MKPWFIFGGTMTWVEYGTTADEAFERWNAARLLPCTRDEVTVREPTKDDEGWITDSGSVAFLDAFKKAVA